MDDNDMLRAGRLPDDPLAGCAPVAPVPSQQRTRDGRPYLVRVPGHTVCYLAAHDGYVPIDERLAAVELQRYWPGLDTHREDGRPHSAQTLYARYGARANQVYYTYTGRSRFEDLDGHSGVLYIRCGIDAPPPARRHDDVMDWLALLAGRRIDTVLDWLATLPLLDRPTCALVLIGSRSAGKTMLAHGSSRYFGVGQASYDDVFKGRFNDALLRSPVVVLDEGSQIDASSAGFRSLTANTLHAIEAKHRPTATLMGCPRLIVAANNPDPLRLSREDLTAEDEAAIGERICVVDVDGAAGRWLAERGGRAYTREWVSRADGSPGAIAETIAWLAETRRVRHGHRLLVHGDSAEWCARIGTREGMPAVILDAIAGYLGDPDIRRRVDAVCRPFGGPPFRFDRQYPGTVLVSCDGIMRAWGALLAGDRTPTHRAVASALDRLGTRMRVTLSDGSRPWIYVVSLGLLGDRADVT